MRTKKLIALKFWTLDPPHLSPAGPSVASLKKDCGTKFGQAQKKGLLKWQQAFIVLRQGDDTLYEFRTDLVCSKNIKAKRAKSKNSIQITETWRGSDNISMFWEKQRECMLSLCFKNVVLVYLRLTGVKKAIIRHSGLFVWILKFVCLSCDVTPPL